MKAIRRVWDLHDSLETQFLIDEEYQRKAGVKNKDTFEKRKLALWVEVGELVNEWKELFKFWSNKKMERKKALEEYVDCLHFFLSLGNDLKIDFTHDLIAKIEKPISQIFALSAAITVIESKRGFYEAFALFRGLGDHLGFTEQEIERVFIEKNEANKNREDHVLGGEKNKKVVEVGKSVVLELEKDLLWISNNDGYEVGYDDVLIVSQYKLADTDTYFYIDMESNKILEAWEIKEDE